MRSFIRLDEEITIHYTALPASSAEVEHRPSNDGITKNISVYGICFHSPDELPIDEQLVIDLRLPAQEEPITPIGRVVWCRPAGNGYDVGLELTWFDWQADEQLVFARYINEKSRADEEA